MKPQNVYIHYIAYLIILIAGCVITTSCDDDQTYAEQKKAERRAISSFISLGTLQTDDEVGDTLLYVAPITVISEAQFIAQDSTTDVSKNEYVQFSSTGVYMQIVRKGAGTPLNDSVPETVLVRFKELNIAGDSLQATNWNAYYIAMLDEMTVTKSGDAISGTFKSGMMKTLYSSQVPEGWLIPLNYINISPQTDDTEIAKVRIIVPHSSGQTNAISYVYPCFYELTYQRWY